jgi:hypothetical protein
MPQHLRDACLFAEVTCEETGPGGDHEDGGERLCSEQMRRKELPAHRRKVHNRGDEAKGSVQGVRDLEEEEERRRKDAQDKPDAADDTRLNNQSEDYEEVCLHPIILSLLYKKLKSRLLDELLSARIPGLPIHRPIISYPTPPLLSIRVSARLLLPQRCKNRCRYIEDRSAYRTKPDPST